MPETSYIGAGIPNIDAYDKVVGGRGYPVNVSLPGMLHGKLLRSFYPHANIISIDTSDAQMSSPEAARPKVSASSPVPVPRSSIR